MHCAQCGRDELSAFSCKGRGVCPSCCGRPMADTAVHLADEVLPAVPIRQWVLSFLYRARYLLAYDAKLCSASRRIFVRTLFGWLRERGEGAGIPAGSSGAVVVAQGVSPGAPKAHRIDPADRFDGDPEVRST